MEKHKGTTEENGQRTRRNRSQSQKLLYCQQVNRTRGIWESKSKRTDIELET